MNEYKYIKDGPKYFNECESCGWVAPLASFPIHNPPKKFEGKENKLICEVCSSTIVGIATEYESSSYQPLNLFVALAQGINLVLDKTTNRLSKIGK